MYNWQNMCYIGWGGKYSTELEKNDNNNKINT